MIDKKKTFLGKKILVIGDDSAFLNSIELMFLYAGIDILIFDDLNKGVLAIRTQKPDLILLQSQATDGAFNDILNQIKKENDCDIQIVIVTDVKNQIDTDKRITSIIPKTNIDIVKLVHTIEDLLTTSCNNKNKVSIDITEKSSVPATNPSNDIRILVVEDDPLLRNLLSVKFTKSKIRHFFCHNGNEVLNSAITYKPTLIILDLMLPGKNGIDALHELRQKNDFDKTPVIIFSNKDNDDDRKKAKLLGVDDFLIKAMTDLNDLITLIINKHTS